VNLVADFDWGGYYRIAMIAARQTAPNTPAPASFRMGDERLIKVSSSAAQKVSSLLHRQGRPNGVLRVAVVGGGCSGLQYKMDLQDQPANRDILVESNGVKVVVDPKSALYVTGSELDYIDALQDGGFKVKNPNAASSCSCGESFSA
jgi:iron-sulfur cluster assembly protein